MRPLLALTIAPRSEAKAWLEPIRAALPEVRVEFLENVDPTRVRYCAAWNTIKGLDRCSRIEAILSLGAGVNHILADKRFAHIPIVRMIDPGLTRGMTEFILYAVLHYHRRAPEFAALQKRREWRELYTPLAFERRVGIMGMGVLGSDAARHLRALGFQVAAWTRRPRKLAGVRTYAGTNALPEFLARTEILICLLPLTPATRGILNAELFAQLPKHAVVINAARGGHLVDSDLVAAVDSGHLSGAMLDVFEPEPLPRSSPLWTHSRIAITPHVASITRRDTGARFVARTMRSLLAGKRPRGLVDRRVGY